MIRPTRRALAASAAALGLLAVAACGGGNGGNGGSGSGDGAAEPDALVVYSGRNENLVGPLLEQFTEATGIPVTPRYGGSAELAAQLLEEGEGSPADVFLSQDAGALGALQQADRLEALPQDTLDQVPTRYRSGEGAWVGVSGRSRVLVYNPDLVPESELPQSVFELTEPAYADKVAFAPTNASFQTFVTAMRVTEGEERTRQFLTDLKANGAKPYENNIAILDAVDKGQIAVGLSNHYYLYERAAEAGGLDQITARNHLFPGDDPGSLVNVAGVGVLAGKADERTQAFVDFLLGEQAQSYFAEQTKEYPLVEGVPLDADLPPLTEQQGPDVDLSQLDSLEETLRLLDEVGLT